MTERIPRKVAVTSRSFSRHPALVAELRSEFPDARLNSGESLTGQELVGFLRGYDAAIVALDRIDASLLAAVPELRIISKYGVGLDGLDIEAIERRGVMLGWTPGVNRISVSELTLSSMIALLHRVPEASRDVFAGNWRQIRGRELTGRTVGIIGCGHVGKEVARLCRMFQCRVLVYDIRSYEEFYREHSITPVTIEQLLEEAEIVTMHVPLDRTTANLLDAEKIGRLREGAVFLNMARGGIVDEGAIKRRLLDGTLGGAAFDVFANEPAVDAELVKLPNVIVTPHIGGSSEEAILAMGRAAIEGLHTARSVASWREIGRIS